MVLIFYVPANLLTKCTLTNLLVCFISVLLLNNKFSLLFILGQILTVVSLSRI